MAIEDSAGAFDRFAPAALVRPDTADAATVLVLRCARTGALLLVGIGMSVAVLFNRFDSELANEFSTPSAFLRALASPLVVLGVGVLLRLSVTLAAFTTALLLVFSERLELVGDEEQSFVRHNFDRWRVAGAVRSVRWTWVARDIARQRLGRTGAVLCEVDVVLRVSAIASIFVFLVVATSHQR